MGEPVFLALITADRIITEKNEKKGIIGTFKSFSHIWVLRNDFAGPAADPLSIYIFTVFYGRSRFGYASALSLILMAIVLLLTLFQNRLMKNRIFYGD